MPCIKRPDDPYGFEEVSEEGMDSQDELLLDCTNYDENGDPYIDADKWVLHTERKDWLDVVRGPVIELWSDINNHCGNAQLPILQYADVNKFFQFVCDNSLKSLSIRPSEPYSSTFDPG